MADRIRIYIADEEVICENQFDIEEEILKTSSVILNKVYPKSWTNELLTTYYFPKDYSSCKIYIDNVLKFAGVIKNSGDISLNPFKPKYTSLQILDYKNFLSESKNLDFVLTNVTISQAIARVIEEIEDYGFEVGTIDILNDTTIGAYSTLDKTAYDVLQYLSEISGSIWSTRMIDNDTIAIDFYDNTLLPTANNIEYTQEYFLANNVQDIVWSYGTRDYRNKQFALSDNVYASIDTTQIIIADGYTKSFQTENKIGIIKSISNGATGYLVATDDEKTAGVYADFYYKSGESKFESNSDNDAIATGTALTIIYTALVQGREISTNSGEISRIASQIDRKGEIAQYERRNDITNSNDLKSVADTYIKYKGIPEILLTITTRNTDILNIGQQVNFTNSPITDLQTNYLVKSKTTSIRSTDDEIFVTYTYKLSSNFNSETAINYFDNQRRKLNGNIDQGKYITRNIDIENDIAIEFNNFAITDINSIGDNLLDCILDAPLVD